MWIARKMLVAGAALGGVHAVRFLEAQPERRILGFLLAAVSPGHVARDAVRAANNGHHGPDPKEEMGNATSLFNLMRNIGGSVGIAMVTTLNHRYAQKHIDVLTSHVTPYDTAASHLLQQLHGMSNPTVPQPPATVRWPRSGESFSARRICWRWSISSGADHHVPVDCAARCIYEETYQRAPEEMAH